MQKFTSSEENYIKPCIGDLVQLVNDNLNGEQKSIFCQWAGIDRKKIGKKQIAESLGSKGLTKCLNFIYKTV